MRYSGIRYGGYRVAPHYRHHHFHRRFYAPAYYDYPRYYAYPHRYCRVIWTYYGPRKICRYRPWHRHHHHCATAGITTAIGEASPHGRIRRQAPVEGACSFWSNAGHDGVCRLRAQSQFLNFQGLIFHGVNVSIRHCLEPLGAGGRDAMFPWTRRDRDRRCATMLRRLWRVASLIISTNSGLSAIAGSSRSVHSRKEPVCAPRLNAAFPERLDIEARAVNASP